MKTGKLTPEQLKTLIFSQLGERRDDVLVSARLGEDSAIIDFGDEVCAVSTDPITGAAQNIGKLAVNVACNDLAAMGAQPIGIQVCLLLPEGTPAEMIAEIMSDIDEEAQILGIQVLGGHTEVTDVVRQNVIVATALGRAKKGSYVTSYGAQLGDSIVLTKGAGLEGSGIIATDFPDILKEKGLTLAQLEEARNYLKDISVVKEGLIAAQQGASAMHDVTEGGIIGASFEMAEGAQKGFTIYADQIHIPVVAKEICRLLDIDPLAFISSGAMLITIADPYPLVNALKEEGIAAYVIGEINEGERKIVYPEGHYLKIETAPRDELWKFLKSQKREGDVH